MAKRTLSLLSLVLGILGVVCCAAAMISVWIIDARLVRATGTAFVTIDDSLNGVQQRISQLQKRVQAAKLSSKDIQLQAKLWTMKEARERLEEKLRIEEKAERLAAGLQQADQWLELSESTVQLVEQALVLGNTLGVPVHAEPANRLQEELASLQVQLAEVIDVVQRVKQRAAGDGLETDGANSLARLILRVGATLGTMDSRLENLGIRVKELQNSMRTAGDTSVRWIRIAAISFSVLICWMAAGQGALSYLGWNGIRRREPTGSP